MSSSIIAAVLGNTKATIDGAVGTHREPELYRAEISVKDEITEAVRRTGFPELDEQYLQALVDKYVSQVRVVSPLDLDAERSITDAIAIKNITLLAGKVEQVESEVNILRRRVGAARIERASLTRPQFLTRGLAWLFAMATLMIFASAVAEIMASTAAEFFLPIYGDYQQSYLVGKWVVTTFLTGFLLAKLAAVFVSDGRVSWKTKLPMMMLDVLVAAAFVAIRGEDALSIASLGATALELAPLAAYSLMLFAMAPVLKADRFRLIAWYRASRQVREFSRQLASANERFGEMSARLDQQLEAIAARERGHRTSELHENAISKTVTAEYLTALAELISRREAPVSAPSKGGE